MKKLALALCLVLPVMGFAQPLTRSFPFSMLSRDTALASDLPQTSGEVAGAHGQIKVSNEGHFVTADGERIRFFGTELNYGANFLNSTDARDLARRFKKLGLNAVRINYTDHSNYPTASLFKFDYDNSYHIDTTALMQLDTLIYEFGQAGIYTIFTLQTVHYHWPSDGVAWWPDSLDYPNYMLHYYLDDRAAMLQRKWAKTILSHVNHRTGKRYGDDPLIAGVEINGGSINGSYNFPLSAAWRYGFLNYDTDPATSNITFHRSRKLDTLYTEYLLRKYTSDAGINAAWRGAPVINPPNLLENGSFEQIGSTAWSFSVQGGASGIQTLLSPGKDSEFCMMGALGSLGPNPAVTDAYLLNLSTRCGKDTLYEMHFWAKVRYSAQRPVTTRQIYPIVVSYATGSQALAQYVDIDTTWKEFTLPFRATANGLQYVGFYFGQSLGDVMFDGVSIRRRQELGLISGETTTNRTIIRTPYNRIAQLPYKRIRDISLFYDSLQRNFYDKMIKAIRDTAKCKVLINAYPNWYWASALEAYGNTLSDFAQCYVNTDYYQQRPNIPYSDSTWMISNNTPLRDPGSYALGLVASQSLEGKPMIVNWINPIINQHNGSMLPFVAGYASLQDWDGLFFSPYTMYREGLFSDQFLPAVSYSAYYDVAGNPSLVGQFPALSELFRSARFKAAESYVPIIHDKADVELLPTVADYRHPFNVEGYLDPNVITNFKVRQRYDSPTHKVAAEYPYVPDTSAKTSDTRELFWSQSSGHFVGVGRTAASIGGIFGKDTLKLGGFLLRRTDELRDAIGLTVMSMDTMPLGTSDLTHLTIAGRAQNTGMIWVDSFGFGKNWGTGPTVMSAPVIEFYLHSNKDYVYFHALDEHGERKGHHSAAMIDSASRLFRYTLDTREWKSMWYTIEQTNIPSGVRREEGIAQHADLRIYPNPTTTSSKVMLDLPDGMYVRLSLFDPLGREVITMDHAKLEAGRYSYDLDVTSVPAGRYLLVADLGGERIVRSVSVVK